VPSTALSNQEKCLQPEYDSVSFKQKNEAVEIDPTIENQCKTITFVTVDGLEEKVTSETTEFPSKQTENEPGPHAEKALH
jgi:hypothetical protein